MSSLRGAAALLWGIGLLAGSLADTRALREKPRVDGYWILSGDFHVHSFGGDGALTPWALRREAERRGLDVFAVTNHNQTFAARFARRVARGSGGPIVLAGEEITGRKYHLIAVGIERTVDWDQPAAAAIADIHAQGGVAIAAHPARRHWDGFDDRALASIDGVEAAHPEVHVEASARTEIEEFYRRARARNPGIAAIGSSDFHAMRAPGLCRTFLLATEPTEAGVLDALRAGRTVASDRDGNLIGDPAHVRMVRTARATAAPAGGDAARGLSIGCSWIGLLGMVVLAGAAQRAGSA